MGPVVRRRRGRHCNFVKLQLCQTATTATHTVANALPAQTRMEVAKTARRSAAAQLILDDQLRSASLTAAAVSAAERATASGASPAAAAAGRAAASDASLPAEAAEQVALTTAAPAIAGADQPAAADAAESAQQEPFAIFDMFSAVAFVLFLKP